MHDEAWHLPSYPLPEDHPAAAEAESLIASGDIDDTIDVYFPQATTEDDLPRGLLADGAPTFGTDMPWLTAASIVAPTSDEGEYTVYIVPMGVETSDKRFIEEGALDWREPPLPLMFIDRYTMGHDDAEFVGNITNLRTVQWRGNEWVAGDVTWDDGSDNETAAKAKRLVDELRMFGVSADIVDVDGRLDVIEVDEDGFPIDWLEVLTQGTVAGATIVPIPAFEDARIEGPNSETDDDAADETTAAAAGGYDLAAEIAEKVASILNIDTAAVEDSLTAGALIEMPDVLPAAAFVDPQLDRPTGLTVVEDDGVVRIYGHAALWGTCHTGITDRCVTPPKSGNDYADFLLSRVETDDGYLAVGTITMDTGHAMSGKLTAEQTRAHYDNTGTAAAWVSVGEDEHGIWFSGVLNGRMTADDVRTLAASKLSGDWRFSNGQLELVALLAVNMPGFPVPQLLETDHKQTALVAAGVVDAEPDSECAPCQEQTTDDDVFSDVFTYAVPVSEWAAIDPRGQFVQDATITLDESGPTFWIESPYQLSSFERYRQSVDADDGRFGLTVDQYDAALGDLRDQCGITRELFEQIPSDVQRFWLSSIGYDVVQFDTFEAEVGSVTLADDPAFIRFAFHMVEQLQRLADQVEQVRADQQRPHAAKRVDLALDRIGRTVDDIRSDRIDAAMRRIEAAAANGS